MCSFHRCSSVVVSVDGLPGPGSPSACEDPHVCAPEGRVAQCVEHGVHRRIDVAEIVRELPERRGNDAVGLLFTQDGVDDHEHAVRSPRDDEGQQNSAQCLGGLAVLLLLARRLLGLGARTAAAAAAHHRCSSNGRRPLDATACHGQ